MKCFLAFICIGLLALGTSCSSISVTYDYDAQVDFDSLKTYDWLAVPVSDQTDTLVLKRAQRAVIEQLANKGLQKVSRNPDFVIAIRTVIRTRREAVLSYSGRTYGRYWDEHRMDVYEYEEGTLILDFVNVLTRDLIWRGSATGIIDPEATPNQRTERINKAVLKILANFPPTK